MTEEDEDWKRERQKDEWRGTIKGDKEYRNTESNRIKQDNTEQQTPRKTNHTSSSSVFPPTTRSTG